MTTMEVTLNRKQIAGAELLNLLVIDDERAVRESCREAAQANGFNTFAAESAERRLVPECGNMGRRSCV